MGVASERLRGLLRLLVGGAAFSLVASFPSAPAVALPVRRPPVNVPATISIARVDVQVRRDAALVTTDVTFSRGSLSATDDLDVFVAYGSPGIPRAFDAQLVPVNEGSFLSSLDERGTTLAVEHELQAPSYVAFSLGRIGMAGATVHATPADLTRSLATSGLATLRLRSVHAFAPSDEPSVTVRIATPRLGPFPLGMISVRGDGVEIASASASLCSLSATSTELALSTGPRRPAAIAPPLVKRAIDDDLCVRASVRKSP